MPATFLQLRTRAKQRANMENSNFVTAAELQDYVNESYRDLWQQVEAAAGEHFVTSVDFTLAGGVGGNTYALPADFSRARALDYSTGGGADSWRRVARFNFAARNSTFAKQYRIMGGLLRVHPESDAGGTYRLWYLQAPTALAADGDTISAMVFPWEEFIVVDAAIKMLVKEESDSSALAGARRLITDRIANMAADRDQGEAEKIADVDGWVSPLPGAL